MLLMLQHAQSLPDVSLRGEKDFGWIFQWSAELAVSGNGRPSVRLWVDGV